MPHYERNIRLILFLILPILGFLLGWTLNQKSNTPKNGQAVSIEPQTETTNSDLLAQTPKNENKKRKKIDPKDVDLDILWETWSVIENNFLYPERLETKNQVYGATKGLVNSLDDPYTIFMDPEEYNKFNESINGEFEGIGAEIAIREERLTIVSPLKGSPAELAGIEAGDVIFAIDEKPTFDMTIDEAIVKIRGPKGEKVVLTIVREDEPKPLEITIVRDTIVLDSVEWEMHDNIAVISLSQFGTDAYKEFQEAINEIILKKPQGMILDLRNNGGGLLNVCVDIATEFFNQKIVVQTKGRKFGDSGDIMSGRDGAFVNIPLLVLTNKGSASASEIFVGAVQDHNRGLVLGDKTFGKGSVQHVIPLSDGSSLKITIAEWLTPHGRSIHEKGLAPDISVEVTKEDIENEIDPVLDRALELIGTDEMDQLLEQQKQKIESGEWEKTLETATGTTGEE